MSKDGANGEETRAGTDHGESKARNRDRTLGFVQLALVVLFIGGAFLFSQYLASFRTFPGPERRTVRQTLLVETAMVEPRDFRLRFATTGTVQVRAMTDIVPQVSGRIVAIDDSAFPGGFFTSETVLFEIEKEDYRLEIRRMEAEVARARTRLELQRASSEAAVEDWREIDPDTPAPPLVAEKPQLEEAKAALDAAEARLEIARLNLERTEYSLPFTGRVTEFSLEKGQYVVAGQSYGQAYRLASLEIDVPLEHRQLEWLLEAEDPVITVASGHFEPEEYGAFVKRIAGKVDPETRFSRAVLGLRESRHNLVPDMFVHVRVVGPARENVWTFPIEALQENGGVWVVTDDGRLAAIRPEIVQITEEFVVAKSDGETVRVVRGNLPEATEDTPVRLAGVEEEEREEETEAIAHESR